nr:hypothetical protein CFP56_02771 [Quercus suber]
MPRFSISLPCAPLWRSAKGSPSVSTQQSAIQRQACQWTAVTPSMEVVVCLARLFASAPDALAVSSARIGLLRSSILVSRTVSYYADSSPNTSRQIHLSDILVSGPLEVAYCDQVERWGRGYVGTIGKEHVTYLYKPSRERALTTRNVRAGYANAGLYPTSAANARHACHFNVNRDFGLATHLDKTRLTPARCDQQTAPIASYAETHQRYPTLTRRTCPAPRAEEVLGGDKLRNQGSLSHQIRSDTNRKSNSEKARAKRGLKEAEKEAKRNEREPKTTADEVKCGRKRKIVALRAEARSKTVGRQQYRSEL